MVWLTSSKEEMNPPIVPYKKKVRNKVRNINENTELSVSYNSHPPQPHYHPPPPHHQPHGIGIPIPRLIPPNIVISIH